MKYINAGEILPEELIRNIQSYAAGVYVYIPSLEEKKVWGTNTGTRQKLTERNEEICRQYEEGVSIRELSLRYCLCESSIYKILRKRSL